VYIRAHRVGLVKQIVENTESWRSQVACESDDRKLKSLDKFNSESEDEGSRAAVQRALTMASVTLGRPVESSKRFRKDRAAIPTEHISQPAKKAKTKATAPVGVSVEHYRSQNHIRSPLGNMHLWPDPMQTLQQLPFDQKVTCLMHASGFSAPSPIQAQSWPIILAGSDLIAVAKTGSGKTLGYLVPIFHLIMRQQDQQASRATSVTTSGPLSLVLAPTRELALQIHTESERFGEPMGVRSCVVYGGVPKAGQIFDLKLDPHVLIATPGRLVDLMQGGGASVRAVRYVVGVSVRILTGPRLRLLRPTI
jgi:hypothetical protein